MKDIIIYTDGACKYNPGPGGYAAIIMYEKHASHLEDENDIIKKIVGGDKNTTNNIMELTAINKAFKYILEIVEKKENIAAIDKNGLNIYAYVDSNYVLKGLNEWSINWVKKDFKGVKNSELWKDTIKVYNNILNNNNIQIIFKKVKGHSGQKYNEIVDKLASDKAKEIGGI